MTLYHVLRCIWEIAKFTRATYLSQVLLMVPNLDLVVLGARVNPSNLSRCETI